MANAVTAYHPVRPLQGGRPYAGARGSAGTLGFSPVSTVCTRCGEPLAPLVVDLASGPAPARA